MMTAGVLSPFLAESAAVSQQAESAAQEETDERADSPIPEAADAAHRSSTGAAAASCISSVWWKSVVALQRPLNEARSSRGCEDRWGKEEKSSIFDRHAITSRARGVSRMRQEPRQEQHTGRWQTATANRACSRIVSRVGFHPNHSALLAPTVPSCVNRLLRKHSDSNGSEVTQQAHQRQER